MTSTAAFWDSSIVPTLVDYIRVPAKSPHFDRDWAKPHANAHGPNEFLHIEYAKKLTAAAADVIAAQAGGRGARRLPETNLGVS